MLIKEIIGSRLEIPNPISEVDKLAMVLEKGYYEAINLEFFFFLSPYARIGNNIS